MKKICLLLLSCIVLFACKKNSSVPEEKTILLTRSISNGKTNYKFVYSPDKKLTRIEGYDETPANAPSITFDITYHDNGQIEQLTSYQEPGSVAITRSVIQYNADNKIQSAAIYDLQGATPNVATSSSTWTYNAKGNFIKLVRKDKNDRLIEQTNISYYDNNTIKQIDSYGENGGLLVLKSKSIFSVPAGEYPPGLEQLMIILGADFTASMYNETIQRYQYDQNGVITYNTMQQMSARQFNADGTLNKQTITLKKIKPADTDVITFKQYEYSTN